MKKIISLLFGLLFLSTIAFATGPYNDFPPNHDYANALEYLQKNNILRGDDDTGLIRPDDTINRAEFTALVLRANNDHNSVIGEFGNCFSDVTNQWYAADICYLASVGKVQGYPDGKFHPGRDISFVEAAKIMLEVKSANSTTYLPANGQSWHEPYVNRFETSKRIPPSIQDLSQNISRGEMAEMLYRNRVSAKNGEQYVVFEGRNPKIEYVDISSVYDDLEIKADGIHYNGELQQTIDFDSYIQLNEHYGKDKDHVYQTLSLFFEDDLIVEGADPRTFKLREDLGRYFAEDANYIYDYGVRMEDADKETFAVLEKDYYWKDKSNVYHRFYYECYGGCAPTPIEGADPRTFESLPDSFAKDRNHVYKYAQKIDQLETNSFEYLGSIEFNYLNYSIIKDNNGVYYIDNSDGPLSTALLTIDSAHINTFAVVDGARAMDITSVYVFLDHSSFRGKGSTWDTINKFVGADIDTLKLLDTHYAKDKDNVYYADERLENADADTFKALNFWYAKDKNNVYYADWFGNGFQSPVIVEDADPNTFKVLTGRKAQDANHLFEDGIKTQSSFEFIGSVEFEKINYELYEGDRNIYYQTTSNVPEVTIYQSDYQILDQADPDAFRRLSNYIWKDNDQYFVFADSHGPFLGKGGGWKTINRFSSIDPSTFQFLNSKYAKDKNYVYFGYAGSLINPGPPMALEYIDQNTFQVLDHYYAKDKNSVYYSGYVDGLGWQLPVVVDGADVASFLPTASGGAQDKDNTFKDGEIAQDLTRFAQCLQNKATMYGAYWCPHCAVQKDLFGDNAFEYIDYVECDENGDNAQPQLCADNDITAYPTWFIEGEEWAMGVQTLEALSQATGCNL